MLKECISKLASRQNLSRDESAQAAHSLADESIGVNLKKEFLLALADKGETADEVAAFAATFRGLARDPGLSEFAPGAIDVCGTGGDHSGSFNVSTVVSFVLASAGVTVFKHGNRSITSSCGSADVLEAVGIKLDSDDELMRRSIENLNFVFFFAPAFHPAFKAIMPVRKALAEEGRRTIFNVLGPLINPGKPSKQLMGVFSKDWVEPLANALHALELSRGMLVHCQTEGGGAMDELSCAGVNHVAGFGSLSEEKGIWRAEDFMLEPCKLEDLKGGSVDDNMLMLSRLLDGKEMKGLEDTILWNAGTALWIAEKSADVKEGIALARECLLGGAVKSWLVKVKEVYGS